MSFTLTMNRDEQVLLHELQKEDENLAIADIGFDDETNATYKILVALVPIPGRPPSHRDLLFLVSETSMGTPDTAEYSNGLQTKRFLSDVDRTIVLDGIATIAAHMVGELSLEVLTINTIETYLPEKALSKYEVICDKIKKLGYIGGKVDSYLGQQQWVLEKQRQN